MPLFCTAGPLSVLNLKWTKVRRLQQLRQRDLAVVGGVGRIVGEAAVVVLEADEARVFDAVALAGRGRKEDALRNAAVGREVHFVIRFRQQQDAAGRADGRGVGGVRRQARRQQNRVQFLQREILVQLVQHAPAKIILHARLLQFVGKQSLDVSGIGHALRLGHKRHGRRERDAMLRADRARCGR